MPRTLTSAAAARSQTIMVRVIEEVEERPTWWSCQPQKGPVDNPEDDDNFEPLEAWWSCDDTQPVATRVLWCTQIASNGQWVLSARCCDDTETAE